LLKNTISYLRQNRDAIDDKSLAKLNTALALTTLGDSVDPIDRLLSLQRAELSTAYDTLLSCLEQRETVIEQRIKQQVDHLGKEERIIFEEKDWSREVEDIKSFEDPFSSDYRAEEILAVSE
jgi:DNA-binding transcriptional MerR regulator